MPRYLLTILLATHGAVAAAESLYVFTRPGCSPCDRLKATLAADPDIAAGYEVYLIDTKKTPSLARRYGVTSVPVLVVERDGEEVSRMVGFSEKQQLAAWLSENKK